MKIRKGNETLLLIREKKTEMPRPFCLTFRFHIKLSVNKTNLAYTSYLLLISKLSQRVGHD